LSGGFTLAVSNQSSSSLARISDTQGYIVNPRYGDTG
jgi:hypothetical protein